MNRFVAVAAAAAVAAGAQAQYSTDFEGMMAWNGKSGKLDFLFVVEPGSWAQERGSLHAELDGSIVREVELTAANGVVTQFRQTIRRVDANTAITSLMTRKEDGWEPNFPGSDRIEMRRQ